jgi:RNA polymerase sigma-70 factor (ECF subfamily)
MSDLPRAATDSSGFRVEMDGLMELYQKGDESATIALIRNVSPLLFRFFLRFPGNQDHAPDLLQETWLRVHKVRHTYRPGEPVLPWLYAIAGHVRVDEYRRRRRVALNEQSLHGLPEPPASNQPNRGGLPDFATLMGVLPENQREVVIMLKETGMSLEDVARATASSVGAVKQKAHRAYRKLRRFLERIPAEKEPLQQ